MLLPTLLIFLVPYCILSTVFIIMLLSRKTIDPMERIPDMDMVPVKDKKGPPRLVERFPHDSPLPQHLLTTMNKPVKIGDIEVTPLEVRKTPEGDLMLRLKTRNVSQNLAFMPVSESFLKATQEFKPYTFLHSRDLVYRVYGGYLRFATSKGDDREGGGELKPGEEEIIEITTMDQDRQKDLKRILTSQDKVLWRIQLRRGLVEVSGREQPLSATAIVGVEFPVSAILPPLAA
jgi:hypothetical protein